MAAPIPTSHGCTRSCRATDADCTFSDRWPTELTALYDIADLFLCASEHEDSAFHWWAFHKRGAGHRLRLPPCRPRWTAGGVLCTSKDPRHVSLMNGVISDAASRPTLTPGRARRPLLREVHRHTASFRGPDLSMPKRPPRSVMRLLAAVRAGGRLEAIRRRRGAGALPPLRRNDP